MNECKEIKDKIVESFEVLNAHELPIDETIGLKRM